MGLPVPPFAADLFGRLHKSTIQRKIRRAEQAGLGYERGTSESLLRQFYDLMVLTRRRHTLPPQPIAWFRNLVTCLGDRLTIRVASLDGRPVASVLTLSHGRTLVYKYGCSDAAFHHLGSMPFVLWKVIEEAKAIGMDELDLGRFLAQRGIYELPRTQARRGPLRNAPREHGGCDRV
jgi:lipid II:glycine glycyltransferase (peptidoglycan interpeptide bridge formation enzyme)